MKSARREKLSLPLASDRELEITTKPHASQEVPTKAIVQPRFFDLFWHVIEIVGQSIRGLWEVLMRYAVDLF